MNEIQPHTEMLLVQTIVESTRQRKNTIFFLKQEKIEKRTRNQ